MSTSSALSFLRGRCLLNTSLDFFFISRIVPTFDHLLFLESSFRLIASFFLPQAFGNILQRKIWVCRLLGEGFS